MSNNRMAVVSKGVIGEMFIPAMVPGNVICSNGDILVFCHNSCDLSEDEGVYFYRSKDTGKTWELGEYSFKSMYKRGGIEASTTITCLKDGTLVMPFVDGYFIKKGEINRHINMCTAVSEDNGYTWKNVDILVSSMIETFPYGKIIEFEDYLMLTVCGSCNNFGTGNWQVQTLYSESKTEISWENYYTITKNQGDETSTVLLPVGSLVSVIRGYKDYFMDRDKNHRKHPFYISFSTTEGKFWTKPKNMGIRGTTPCLHVTPKGNLLFGYRKIRRHR